VRRPRGALALAGVAACALGACATRARSGPNTVSNQSPFVVVPLGLCEDYPEASRSIEEVRRDLALLKRAGVGILRVSFGWDGIEPQRGRFELAFWDAFMAETTAVGVRVIPYVAYTPRWEAPAGASDYWRRPPRDLDAFAGAMRVLAGRYRGQIASWEIWNEPDNPDFWRGSVADYVALLAAGARAVRAADPQAKVVLGGIAGHPQFAAEVLARPEIAGLVDVVNAHAYFETWNPEPTEALPGYVAAFAPALAGGARPLWLAEVGYSAFRRDGAVSADVRARFDYEHTLPFQAVELVRTITLAFTRPEVALLAWYEVKDPPPAAPVIGDENNRHLGVAFSDWRPKPALNALALVARLFGAGFQRLDDRLRVVRPAASHAEVHAFLTAAHHAVAVAWLPTDVPGLPAGDGQARDERVERLSLALPVIPLGAPRELDAEGRERPLAAGRLVVAAGSFRIDDVQVKGGEVVLLDVAVQ